MSDQLESSNPGNDQRKSSPVWNFHGPVRTAEDSPRFTGKTDLPDGTASRLGLSAGAPTYALDGIAHRSSRSSRNMSPARRIEALFPWLGITHADTAPQTWQTI